ncbi:MAG: acyl transferase [Bacteroidota bacterium]
MILSEKIFEISDQKTFNSLAFEVFEYQFKNNPLYRSFCDLLYKHPSSIKQIQDIPFLPISFFKSKKVMSGAQVASKVFTSSGTTGSIPSKHYVSDINLYEDSFTKGFRKFYGDIENYAILGLLPSYLEREGSSLIYMVDQLIKKSKHPNSGFYLDNLEELNATLNKLEQARTKTLLIGVSFALLNFIERFPQNLNYTTVMETGGMKGRRKELIRHDLHEILKNGFGVDKIHSEYGMTELLSQAYSNGDGIYQCPNWMCVFTRETEDPLSIQHNNKSGGLNIIDFANIHSCSFIATQDLGRVQSNGNFEVIGRFDNSDIRGCNLMAL